MTQSSESNLTNDQDQDEAARVGGGPAQDLAVPLEADIVAVPVQEAELTLGEPASDLNYRLTSQIAVIADPSGVRAESIHALRTHLAAKHVRDGKRGLAICGSDDQAGAVFVAVNLAVSFAQAGFRTLLIDADMRAPHVQNFIIPSVDLPGLRQCLEDDRMAIGQAIQPDVLPHLSVMFAGGHADSAQELLAGSRFKQLADLCLRDYEVTIIATPSSNICADARRVAAVVRYAMVVARKDVTFLSDVNTLVSELSGDGVRVIGSVFNAF